MSEEKSVNESKNGMTDFEERINKRIHDEVIAMGKQMRAIVEKNEENLKNLKEELQRSNMREVKLEEELEKMKIRLFYTEKEALELRRVCGVGEDQVAKFRSKLSLSEKQKETSEREKFERKRLYESVKEFFGKEFGRACNCYWGINGETINRKQALEIYDQIESVGGKLDGNAHWIRGNVHLLGYGVEKGDFEKHFKKAADYYSSKQENELTRLDLANIGYMYVNGYGFTKDEERGVKFLEKAVQDSGNAQAMWHLGVNLQTKKHNMKKSSVQSVELFQMAVKHGLPDAMFSLACLLEEDEGECGPIAEKNSQEAMEMFQRAAESGERWSIYKLGKMYVEGGDVKLGREFLRRAKELGL